MTAGADAAPISRASVGLRSERGPILGSVMLSIALVAIDTTILATAVPAIVADLGGFTQFPWMFSAFLLAQAVTTPIYGKLADVVGRKPLMQLGIGLFLLGSVLCAVAWSMPALIAARAVQGLGAGAIQPTGMTIMGDIYSVAERAVAQAYIAGVWATSAVVGPTLGGLLSEHLSWRWIFWINLPLGLLAAVVLQRRFTEHTSHGEARAEGARRPPLDLLGALVVAAAAGLLLLGLLEGGLRWDWDSPTSIAIFAGFAVLVGATVLVERRAADPVLPGWLFGRRVVNAATLGAFVVGAAMLGVTSYVPVYAQSVLGAGPVVAGLAVAALAIGWPIAASTSGWFYVRRGFRPLLLAGALFAVLGSGTLTLVGPGSSVWLLAVGCLVLGMGLGYVASPSIVAAQSAVDWSRRGVVTGANMFSRSVGSAVGVAFYGALANGIVAARTGAGTGGTELEDLPADVLDPALHAVFVAVAGTAALLLLAWAVMPRQAGAPAAAEPAAEVPAASTEAPADRHSAM